MIQIDCDCGKTLKLKDEHAGKKVRCPGCSTIHSVPAQDEPVDDWDDVEESESPPIPRAKKSAKKSGKARKAKSSGSVFKRIFGGLAIVLGVAIGAGIAYIAFVGGKPKALKGIVLPFVMIGMGIAWVKGETYGG